MTDYTVPQPSVLDRDGNILLHGLEGVTIPLTFTNAEGVAQNISARDLFFEIKGLPRIVVGPGSSAQERVITITRDEVDALSLSSRGTPFALVDDTGTVPDVVWEGSIIVRGFRAPEAP